MQARLVAAIFAGSVVLAACSTSGGPTSASQTQGPSSNGPVDTTAPSAAPSDAPAAETFASITLTGKGNKIAKFKIPDDAPAIATFSAKGSDNFIVTSLDSSGSENDVLVNVIGSYAGTVLFDENDGQHSVAFKIEASGFSWSIKIRPLSSAPTWSGAKKLSGRGDSVYQLSPASSGLTTITATSSGKENFIVDGFSSDGQDNIVNEIGHFSGQSALADGTFLITVEDDGAWTLELGS
jgi:hypothetical protein